MSARFEVTVATQNILLDKGRTKRGLILPQDDRIDSMAATLDAFDCPFDVIGIQEAFESKNQHNGIVLADKLGYAESYWYSHNQPPYKGSPRGRNGEHIGIFGKLVNRAEVIELGDNRRAVMTLIANVAFVNIHLRSGSGEASQLRYLQAKQLIGALEGFPDAVIFGDFNEPAIPFYSGARKALRDEGFVSAFEAKPQPERPPITCPVPEYRDITSNGHGWRGKVMKLGWPIDDIIIRGNISALDAGTIEPVALKPSNAINSFFDGAPRVPTDHRGVWAKLGIEHANSSDS